MSRVDHETGREIENPFYEVSLVVRDRANDRFAVSNAGATVSENTLDRVRDSLRNCINDLSMEIGFVVDGVTGSCGGSHGSVQLGGVYDAHGQYRFIELRDAQAKLPRCAQTLLENPAGWLERTAEGALIRSAWAQQLYNRLMK